MRSLEGWVGFGWIGLHICEFQPFILKYADKTQILAGFLNCLIKWGGGIWKGNLLREKRGGGWVWVKE